MKYPIIAVNVTQIGKNIQYTLFKRTKTIEDSEYISEKEDKITAFTIGMDKSMNTRTVRRPRTTSTTQTKKSRPKLNIVQS